MAIDTAIVSPLTTEAILGLDLLREHKALIDIPQKQLYLRDKQCTLPLQEPAPVAITTVGPLQDNHATRLCEAQLAEFLYYSTIANITLVSNTLGSPYTLNTCYQSQGYRRNRNSMWE